MTALRRKLGNRRALVHVEKPLAALLRRMRGDALAGQLHKVVDV